MTTETAQHTARSYHATTTTPADHRRPRRRQSTAAAAAAATNSNVIMMTIAAVQLILLLTCCSLASSAIAASSAPSTTRQHRGAFDAHEPRPDPTDSTADLRGGPAGPRDRRWPSERPPRLRPSASASDREEPAAAAPAGNEWDSFKFDQPPPTHANRANSTSGQRSKPTNTRNRNSMSSGGKKEITDDDIDTVDALIELLNMANRKLVEQKSKLASANRTLASHSTSKIRVLANEMSILPKMSKRRDSPSGTIVDLQFAPADAPLEPLEQQPSATTARETRARGGELANSYSDHSDYSSNSNSNSNSTEASPGHLAELDSRTRNKKKRRRQAGATAPALGAKRRRFRTTTPKPRSMDPASIDESPTDERRGSNGTSPLRQEDTNSTRISGVGGQDQDQDQRVGSSAGNHDAADWSLVRAGFGEPAAGAAQKRADIMQTRSQEWVVPQVELAKHHGRQEGHHNQGPHSQAQDNPLHDHKPLAARDLLSMRRQQQQQQELGLYGERPAAEALDPYQPRPAPHPMLLLAGGPGAQTPHPFGPLGPALPGARYGPSPLYESSLQRPPPEHLLGPPAARAPGGGLGGQRFELEEGRPYDDDGRDQPRPTASPMLSRLGDSLASGGAGGHLEGHLGGAQPHLQQHELDNPLHQMLVAAKRQQEAAQAYERRRLNYELELRQREDQMRRQHEANLKQQRAKISQQQQQQQQQQNEQQANQQQQQQQQNQSQSQSEPEEGDQSGNNNNNSSNQEQEQEPNNGNGDQQEQQQQEDNNNNNNSDQQQQQQPEDQDMKNFQNSFDTDFTDLFPPGVLSEAEIKEMRRHQEEQRRQEASEKQQQQDENESPDQGEADSGAGGGGGETNAPENQDSAQANSEQQQVDPGAEQQQQPPPQQQQGRNETAVKLQSRSNVTTAPPVAATTTSTTTSTTSTTTTTTTRRPQASAVSGAKDSAGHQLPAYLFRNATSSSQQPAGPTSSRPVGPAESRRRQLSPTAMMVLDSEFHDRYLRGAARERAGGPAGAANLVDSSSSPLVMLLAATTNANANRQQFDDTNNLADVEQADGASSSQVGPPGSYLDIWGT